MRPRSGLCNRLRALLSAQQAAEGCGRRLVVDWPRNTECGAALDDLLVHGFDQLGGLSRPLLRRLPAARDLEPGRWLVRLETQHVVQATARPTAWFDWVTGMADVSLRPELTHRVAQVDEQLGDRPRIGAQIRTHEQAHRRSKEGSPLDGFSDRLGALLVDIPDAVVFASCDTPEAEARLQGELGDRLVLLPGKSAYASVGGAQDALCDLYVLSSCQYLVTAVGSSMGTLARLMQAELACESAADRLGLDPGLALASPVPPALREQLARGRWQLPPDHVARLASAGVLLEVG